MTFLPKRLADDGDALVDALMTLIDREAPDVRARCLVAIRDGAYQVIREPLKVSFVFPAEVPPLVCELNLVVEGRRSDA